MKKVILIGLCLCMYCFTNAQTITAAEFFVDTDPGAGNATAISVPNSATSSFAATVPTTLLSSGFHFVGIRTKDSDGKWGMFENRGFYISQATTNVGNITAAEFFVDADPGAGNGTAITVPSGNTSTFAVAVPTTSLASGFHFISIRTKDVSGKWGMFENRGFYISQATTDAGVITAAEFFIDTDPGAGNGTAITLPAGNTSTFVATVPTTSLATGFHFISIRTKDVNGKWGMFENRGFYISQATTDAGVITAAEFFIDTDPGAGNGTAITLPAGNTSTFVATVPTTSLATGFHFISIRTKDVNGKWGMFENRGFYISQATTNVGNITAAEYFIDTDPGIGNGIALAVNTPGATVSQIFEINTSILTPQGQHFVAIRVKDANGKWSLFDFKTFTLDGLQYNWVGTTNTLWNINTNWADATLPTTGGDIHVPTGVPNMPALVAATNIRNLSLATNTTLSLNNQQLFVNGNVNGAGTFTGTAASNLMIGGAAGTLNFTPGSQILKDLTLRPGASAALGTALNITAGTNAGTVIDSLGAVLTTNGNLTLKSDDDGTAKIGRSAGTIVGNVTVERNIANPGRRTWHLMGVSTTGPQTIFDSWQEGGAFVPNKGTWITCPTPVVLPGFDGTSVNGASILILDQTVPSWTSIPVANTNSTALSSQPGYMLFVRGDRNHTPTLPTPSATNRTVLKSTGALRQGTQAAVTVSSTTIGRTLVSNPFASSIDFDSIHATPNLDQNFFIWDPTLTGNFGVGGFRVVQRIGNDNYQATPSLGAGSDNTLRYIHSGQAFLLKATGANANVVFGENAKVTQTSVVFPIVTTAPDQQIIANLVIVNAGNVESLADGIRVRYDALYDANISDDIIKVDNFAENISSNRQSTKLIVEHRPMIQSTDTIFLHITNTGLKAYRLKINTLDFVQTAVGAWLQDSYLNTNTPLNVNGLINNVDFSVTADAASANPDRFRIVFAQSGTLPVTFTSIKAYQQTNNIVVEWKVSNQLNIEKYEVEKSIDGRIFTKVATQAATGVYSSSAVYNWLDLHAVSGNHFYRILSIGIGGDVKYSAIAKVTVANNKPAISVYPNPIANGIFSLQITDLPEGIYQLRLINTLGQVVLQQQLKHSGGSATQTRMLDKNIANGIYRMEFIKPDNTLIEKVSIIVGK